MGPIETATRARWQASVTRIIEAGLVPARLAALQQERAGLARENAALKAALEDAQRRLDAAEDQIVIVRRAQAEAAYELHGEPVRMRAVVNAAARHFNVHADEILSHQHDLAFVTARHAAMYVCTRLTGKSLPEIGRYFGGRDHSTIVHGRNKIRRALRADAPPAQDVRAIMAALGASQEAMAEPGAPVSAQVQA